MNLAELDPGPFAPVVGYAGAILAAAFLLQRVWAVRVADWQSPDENLPGTAARVVALLSGMGMVALWLYAAPNVLWQTVTLGIACAVLLCVAYILYYFLNGTLIYTVERADGESASKKKKIVGGLWLTGTAKEAKRKHHVTTTQDLLQGAAYDPDKLWSRTSRGMAKVFLLVLFLTVMVSGTLAITSAGFATQVHLTGKSAASIIKRAESPGLKTEPEEPHGGNRGDRKAKSLTPRSATQEE
jgi:hypothetical protein